MNIKTKLAKTFLALLAVNQLACQDDKNIKDYWKLEEPTVNILQESDSGIYKDIKEKISDFNKKNRSMSVVLYGSYLQFSNIDSEVSFDIESICEKGKITYRGFYPNEKIYNKIYLYNFLPPEIVVVKPGNDDVVPFCKFNFVATNKIGSKHSFSLDQLAYLTHKANGLIMFSRDKNDLKINILNEKHDDGYLTETYLDLSEDSSMSYFSRASFGSEFAIKNPKIICDVTTTGDKKLEFRTIGTDLNINDYIKDSMSNYIGALLRKCRIFSELIHTEDNIEKQDYQKLWSSYFDILFKKPILKAEVEMKYDPEIYPKLNTTSVDYKIASLKITNQGSLPISVVLPNYGFATNNLEAMVFSANKRFENPFNRQIEPLSKRFVKQFSSEMVPDAIINSKIDSYITLKYQNNLSLVSSFGVGETRVVDIILNKNFSCLFKGKYAESGFYIQAIASKSMADKLKVLVDDQNESKEIPINYYLTDLLVAKSAINPLNNRNYLLDTVIIPYFANLKVHETMDYGQNYIQLLNSKIPSQPGKSGYSHYMTVLKKEKMKGFKRYCSIFE